MPFARKRGRFAAVVALVLSWATPALPANIQKLGQECRAGRQKACAQLARIAGTHRDETIRVSAVTQLADQALLASLAERRL
jgi:hypothetical protein